MVGWTALQTGPVSAAAAAAAALCLGKDLQVAMCV